MKSFIYRELILQTFAEDTLDYLQNGSNVSTAIKPNQDKITKINR